MDSSNRKILSVSQLNKTAKHILETEFSFLYVEGEISNFAQPSSGHWYFTLKDEKAQVRCAMFRNRNQSVDFEPKNGQQVILHGKVSLYEGRGEFQVIANSLENSGDGELRRAFEKLKTSLQKEGLFDSSHKKPIPDLPARLAIITSPTGAAIKDIYSVISRRFPAMIMTVIPTQVQGDEAIPQIVEAIEKANEQDSGYDLVLLARGGGSLEDLWAFNTEPVARAIFKSRLPLVSAIGHESDVTISDFVADLRAPTPSAAAEQITPDSDKLKSELLEKENRLIRMAERVVRNFHKELTHIFRRIRHPNTRLNDYAQRLDDLERRFSQSLKSIVEKKQTQLEQKHLTPPTRKIEQLESALKQHLGTIIHSELKSRLDRKNLVERDLARLEALSPFATLKRGYAIVSAERDNQIIRDPKQVPEGENLRIRLSEGNLRAEVIEDESP
ncbi:MAG: exodeoxyribonuclease VII large subunit [Gammaproteobacteria bacterium]|nr:exodeoxyribonuclease VII large subunit [Gammaproteobacteria bacterium]|tara:strand:- start:757 stop:2088 length:1332 start_codon:yes stop_codon:yes gene_type:complete